MVPALSNGVSVPYFIFIKTDLDFEVPALLDPVQKKLNLVDERLSVIEDQYLKLANLLELNESKISEKEET